MMEMEIRRKSKNYFYDVFIRSTLGRYLPQCLQEVAERRPADPIEFIAEWLYKVYDSQIYYKAKIEYLQDLCNTDIILKHEKSEHQAKMKPFLETVRLERWNYYVSLNEELEALADYIENVDVHVDEKSKQRFLEVQNLVNIAEAEMELEDKEFGTSKAISAQDIKSMESINDAVDIQSVASNTRKSIMRDGAANVASAIDTPAVIKSTTTSIGTPKSTRRRVEGRVGHVRSLVSPTRAQARAISTALCSQMHARRAKAIGRPYPDISNVARDYDGSTLSCRSTDESNSYSVRRHVKNFVDRDTRRKTKLIKKGEVTRSKNVLAISFDRRICESGSFNTESLRSSQGYLEDSDLELHSENSAVCGSNIQELQDSEHTISDLVTIRKHSKKNAAATVPVETQHSHDRELPLTREKIRSLESKTEPRELGELKCFSSCSFAMDNKYSETVSHDPSTTQKHTASCYQRDYEHLVKPVVDGHTVGRSTVLSTTTKDDAEYNSDVEDDTEIPRIQQHKTNMFSRRKDACDRLHLPQVKPQSGPIIDEQTQCRSDRALALDRVVQLPFIPPANRTTGSLILTNRGHIAFSSNEFGVVASNSLKIRSVHPMDKPETWEQRNFQSESFYDHELYSQTNVLSEEAEDDDSRYLGIPRMTMEEFIELPRGSLKWNNDKYSP